MLAGGIAGGLFGIGWGILGVVVTFGFVAVAFGAIMLLLFGGADITGGLGAIFLVLLLIGLAVGVVLVVLAVVISQRILRKGGVNRPKAVTWLSLLIALVVNTIAQRIADPFITGFGDDVEVPGWSRVVVSIVLGLFAIGAGIGAWLLMANAFRGATQTPVVVPAPAVPVAAPEPPATTLQTPPPAPPAPPAT